MAKLLLFLFFFIGAAEFLDAQYTINGILSRFRQDYIAYKSNSIHTLDRYSLRVYGTLNSTLYQIMKPFLKSNETWDKACREFPMYKLKSATAKRLLNTCNVTSSIEALAMPTINDGLMSFYSGLLGMALASQQIGEGVFALVEDNMNAIVPLYIASPSCVGSYLGNHSFAYKPAIEALIMVNNKTIANTASIFNNASHASSVAAKTYSTLLSALSKCVNSTLPSDCVDKLVNLIFGGFKILLIHSFGSWRITLTA